MVGVGRLLQDVVCLGLGDWYQMQWQVYIVAAQ